MKTKKTKIDWDEIRDELRALEQDGIYKGLVLDNESRLDDLRAGVADDRAQELLSAEAFLTYQEAVLMYEESHWLKIGRCQFNVGLRASNTFLCARVTMPSRRQQRRTTKFVVVAGCMAGVGHWIATQRHRHRLALDHRRRLADYWERQAARNRRRLETA